MRRSATNTYYPPRGPTYARRDDAAGGNGQGLQADRGDLAKYPIAYGPLASFEAALDRDPRRLHLWPAPRAAGFRACRKLAETPRPRVRLRRTGFRPELA